jgi:hypothetical protein
MGAKRIGKGVVLGMAGLALLLAGQATPARAEGSAVVEVYNAGAHTAIDADLVITGHREALVQGLKPGDGVLRLVPAGMVRFDALTAGTGMARLVTRDKRLRSGKAYCLFVGTAQSMRLMDVTQWLRSDPSPDKVCRALARGR